MIELARRTYNLWRADNGPHIAAALTFYLLLSTAPLLVVLVGVVGRYLGQSDASSQLLEQANTLAGPLGRQAVEMLLNAAGPVGGALPFVATIVAIFAASRTFRELRTAFDTIWDIPPEEPLEGTLLERAKKWVVLQIRNNAAAFAMLLLVGALFTASFMTSTVLAIMSDELAPVLNLTPGVLRSLESVVSVLLVTVLFAMVYRFLPRVAIGWKDVWVGAGVSAALFVAGRILLGLYFTHATPGSAYGAAGSLVAFLIWVNFSVQLALLGAYFTHAWTFMYGSHARERDPRERDVEAPRAAAGTGRSRTA